MMTSYLGGDLQNLKGCLESNQKIILLTFCTTTRSQTVRREFIMIYATQQLRLLHTFTSPWDPFNHTIHPSTYSTTENIKEGLLTPIILRPPNICKYCLLTQIYSIIKDHTNKYSYQKNDTNEYTNIFVLKKHTNEYMNIFV